MSEDEDNKDDKEERYSDGRRKGTRVLGGKKKHKFREPFVKKALEAHPSYDRFTQLQERMYANPYLVVSRGEQFDFETGGSIIDVTDKGRELINSMVLDGKHHNSVAKAMGIHPLTLRNLRKRMPEIEAIFQWAYGEEHDAIYLPLREAAINGESKMLTNNVAIMNSKFGWKQGEERIAGEKKEAAASQFNVQIINLPNSMSRADYNKMMDDPKKAEKFLDVKVVKHEPDSSD